MKNLDDVRADLIHLKYYAVVIYGSYAGNRVDKRSDIDVAVITREKDRNKCLGIWEMILGKTSDIYDIKRYI